MAPAIFHASMNAAAAFIPATLIFFVPLLILVIFAVVHDRMWRRIPQGHTAANGIVGMRLDVPDSSRRIR